jgi:hypothetical protein
MLSVQPPNLAEIALLHEGQIIAGYMNPHRHPEYALALRDAGIASFAVELLPRITRAQVMDALTSQAAVAGYKAVIMAADRLGSSRVSLSFLASSGLKHTKGAGRPRVVRMLTTLDPEQELIFNLFDSTSWLRRSYREEPPKPLRRSARGLLPRG